jgi:condensin complex subunit 1
LLIPLFSFSGPRTLLRPCGELVDVHPHLAEAECLNVLLKGFDHAQLGDEILREIAARSFNAQDTKGPRKFSKFLMQFAKWAPRTVLKQSAATLAPGFRGASIFLFYFVTSSHANGKIAQSYPMRIAIVEIIGHLIRELACSEDLTSDAHQTQN